MTTDLGLPAEIVVRPIVREPDGLAMSSRNRYLSPEERKDALVLKQALKAVETASAAGESDTAVLIDIARRTLAERPAIRIDYVAAVDWATLLPVQSIKPGTLFALAAWVGTTRLIDNVIL